jgi:hypothetical protein
LRRMAMPTVNQAAQKYAQNGAAAASEWQAGAGRFEGDPTALAAAALGKAKTNYSAAIDSGRTARALAAAGKSGWLNGVNRPESASAYSGGITGKGQAKWTTAMNKWFPVFDSLSRQISTMPNNSPQDSINRVAAWINGTIQAKQNL